MGWLHMAMVAGGWGQVCENGPKLSRGAELLLNTGLWGALVSF